MTETPSDIPAVTTNIYNLLQPLKSDERQRVLKAALMMLGDDTAAAGAGSSSSKEQAHDGNLNLPAKAKAWMKKYEINAEQLGHVFHLDGNHEVIASEAPGGNSKLQTINSCAHRHLVTDINWRGQLRRQDCPQGLQVLGLLQ